MNISNYARGLELSDYNKINESAILEADADPAKALEQVKSGKNGGGYAAQWKQVEAAVIAGHEADKTSGTVMVKHDAAVGGKDMVNVAWKITNGKVELSVAPAAPAAPITQTQAASQAVKNAALKIFVALAGGFGEDEEAVYAVFRDDIKSDADLKALIEYWKSQHVPYVPASGKRWNTFADAQKFYTSSKSTDANVTLQYWLKSLFNASEINKVNDYVSKYSTFRF